MRSRNALPQQDVTQRRRTTAAAVKQEALGLLAQSLPEGWISQPLSPGLAGRGTAAAPTSHADAASTAADILVISPRGRCHFLFARAPADRWWDGGLHSVPAEKFSTEDAAMARQLRAAGHKARAIWGQRDLWRALRSWGCPASPARGGARETISTPRGGGATARPRRAVLRLGSKGGRTYE